MEASKNLQKALDDINKKFGSNSVMVLGEQKPVSDNLLSTGSLLIDQALGGGIAKGRVIEVFGAESSGKSTFCLQLAAQCQKEGGVVAYVDAENAMDMDYARRLGVDVDKLIFAQPMSGEQGLEITDMLASSGEVSLIIVDSVAALVPQAELDGEMSDVTIGLQARLMSRALRKITGVLNQHNCAVVFINQIREKISTGWAPPGDSTTTTGGRALKFFASQRIELKKSTAIKQGVDVIGNNVKIKIVKNKVSCPMKVCEVPLVFGRGFDASTEAIDIAIDTGIIEKSGSWLTTHDGQRMQGKDTVIGYYDNNPALKEELISLVKEKIKGVETESQYEVDPETGEVIM